MSYDPSVLRLIRRIGQKRGESEDFIAGNIAVGLVESGLQNLGGGDADSYGYRQQRASIYGRDPLRRQINNLYDEMHKLDRGQGLANLLADVQRPASQYRGRYGERLSEAYKLLGGGGAAGVGGGLVASAPTTSQQMSQPGESNIFTTLAGLNKSQAEKSPAYAQLQRGWELLAQIQNARNGGGKGLIGQATSAGGGISSEGYGGRLGSIINQANKIDAARVPYLWGGGHQAKQTNGKVSPLDCSGAVSRVLGVNPMVSGQFAKWGKPGRGKNVTIYANEDHVLMEINGHFWGTSASNPGGGAGWIPSNQISPDYLKKFHARHPPGL